MRQVTTEKQAEGFALLTNGKLLKTPLGNNIILPNQKLADAVAAEWAGQGSVLKKEQMPLTQIACIAMDMARKKRAELVEDILSYTDTDLVCYRTGETPELLAIQNEQLNPIIAWAKERFSIELTVTSGIMPVAQHPENKQRISDQLAIYNEWQLAVFASAAKTLSSVILSLAFVEKFINAEKAFNLSHLEETFETEKWGEDAEKETRLNKLKQEIIVAEKFIELLTYYPPPFAEV